MLALLAMLIGRRHPLEVTGVFSVYVLTVAAAGMLGYHRFVDATLPNLLLVELQFEGIAMTLGLIVAEMLKPGWLRRLVISNLHDRLMALATATLALLTVIVPAVAVVVGIAAVALAWYGAVVRRRHPKRYCL